MNRCIVYSQRLYSFTRMSESGSRDDDLAARPGDRGKSTQELEDMNAYEEGMSTGTPVDINNDMAGMSHPEEVSDMCREQRWINVQYDCSLGTGIKVGTVNGSLDGRAMADDTTEKAEEPSNEPNQNLVDEVVNGRRRRASLDGVTAKTDNEGDDNNSKDEFETRRKKEKPTKLKDLGEESSNSNDTNLNMKSENSKRRKLPVKNDEYDWHDFIMTSSDEEGAEKPARRKEAKVSNAKKPTTASSSKMKSVELVSTDESKDNPVDKEAAQQICIDDSDELTICDAAAAGRSRNNRPKRRDSVEMMSSVYPRRIVPPLSGGKYAGRRPKKPLFKSHRKIEWLTKLKHFSEESRNSKDTNLNMTRENSKGRKMPESHEEYDWSDFMMTSSDEEGADKPTRRKEAKVPNAKHAKTASSSKTKSIELVSTDESEDNLAEAKLIDLEEQRVRDEGNTRGKFERVKKRGQEVAEKAKLEEREEKRRLVLEQTCREKMRAIEKRRQTERIESNSQGPGPGRDVPSVEVVSESLSGMKQRNVEELSDDRRCNLSRHNQFPCPICSKKFPAEEIAVHAAGCEEYDEASSAGCSGANSPVVRMSVGTPNQRDMFSNMPGKPGLQDHEFEKQTSRKKAKIANAKKSMTASSSKMRSVEPASTNEWKDNLAEAKLILQEERRIRDEAVTQRKVERVKQRLQEEAKKVKLEERNEKLRLAFEQTWREKMRAGQKVPSVEKQRDAEVFSDDWRDNLSQPDHVLCPICSKNFSIGEIEVHAAHCELYDARSSAERSRSNSPVVPGSLERSEQRDMLSNMPSQAGLRDDEVAEVFENGEGDILQSSLVDSPRIVSSRSSSRSSTQRQRLQPEQQKEDEAKLVNLEEQRVRDEEEAQRNAEGLKQLVQVAAKVAKLKELKEKRRSIMEQTWREKLRANEKQRPAERIESSPEGPRQGTDVPSTEVVPENHSGLNQRDVEERSEDGRRNLSQTEQVPCPICGINFPVGEIETHADGCVECAPASSAGCSTSNSPVVPISSRPRKSSAGCSTSNSPVVPISSRPRKSSAGCSTSNSPVVPISSRPPKRRSMFSTLLECYMCSKFTAKNGWEFEAHVASCLARQRELRESVCGNTGS